MFNSFMKEICHKDMLMFIAISLITHCDQHTFFWLAEQVYFDTCIKYIQPPSPPEIFLASKISSLLVTALLKQAGRGMLWHALPAPLQDPQRNTLFFTPLLSRRRISVPRGLFGVERWWVLMDVGVFIES